MKNKQKTTWVFFLFKYRKFLSISLKIKLEHKLFILEVCHITQKLYVLCIYFNFQNT